MVNTDDLIDAHEVAAILGLAQSNTVSSYQKRYPDMPRPVIIKAGGKTKLWVRQDIKRWADRGGRRA